MIRFSSLRLACLGLPLVLAFSNCGDGLETSPNGTGGTSTPTPTPRPSGTATPTPTPTPTPAPTATPGVKSCSLAPLSNCSSNNGPFEFGCCTERNIGSPEAGFEAAIDEAQKFVASTRSELFDNGRVKGGSERAYTAAVSKRLTEQTGICSAAPSYIPEDEITLKSGQTRGQIFDIIQGNGTPTQRYATLCTPPLF